METQGKYERDLIQGKKNGKGTYIWQMEINTLEIGKIM